MNSLSPLEEDIMQLFWQLGKAFPKEIMAFLKDPKPPYNTVLSTIRKLEKEGNLAYTRFGKSHQYYPLIKKEDYLRSFFKKFYHTYLKSNKSELLSYFMEEEELDLKELKKIVKALNQKNHG
ncbi:MAG: BlaI/MecI/CopY family transcriptional regulator [Saprospiraceae bacterium]|nr:BlaI/MecI/CopY family transcriptional regulator [Saprospiraceae bacterium]